MTSSQRTSSTPQHLELEVIDDHEFEYHRQRLKNRIFQEVMRAFGERFERDSFNKADLATVTRRHPSLITRWLSGPRNWTIDTMSDILRAIGAELELKVVFYDDKPMPNRFHSLVPPVEDENAIYQGLFLSDDDRIGKDLTNSRNPVHLDILQVCREQ